MAHNFKYEETNVFVGDTVSVSQEIVEGTKTRLQVFEGIVIAVQNAASGKSFVVRKIGSNNIGVEKIFPVSLPTIKKIEVKRQGKVRRAKLYYLREKVGRSATRIKAKSLFNKAAPAA